MEPDIELRPGWLDEDLERVRRRCEEIDEDEKRFYTKLFSQIEDEENHRENNDDGNPVKNASVRT